MKINRRDFLSHSLKMLGLMGISSVVSENFMRNLVNQAYAGSILDDPDILNSYKYVHITMGGAPPRWYFDLPLTPTGQSSSNFIAGGFGNSYQISGSNVSVVHSTWRHAASGLHLPPVWGMNVSGHNFSDLLQYTGFIRGIDNEIDSHPLSNARQVSPVIGGYSLSGVNADERKNPIAAVNLNGNSAGNAFKSKKNLTATALGISSNPITALLDPFRVKAASSLHSGNTEALVSQVIRKIDEESSALRVTKSSLRESHENAKSLIIAGAQTLADKYPTALAKYTTIVNSAVQPSKGSLPGIFDKAIPGSATDLRFRFGNATTFASIADLRDGITSATTVANMAAQFAVMEILLTTGLTSTVVTNMPGISRFKFTSSATSGTITHDQHEYGNVVQTIINTLYYRAMLGCLHELTRTLNINRMMDKTLIHIATEFNRAPRTNGSGADHGVSGSNTTLISGMIKGPFVIGNIKRNSGSSNYAGTWGVAAPFQLDAEVRPIKVNDIARTISSMLRTNDVVTNGFSLLNPADTIRWEPKVKKADNV